MRTFSCFISDARRGARTQSIVLAQSDERACELARRELLLTPEGVSVEVVEGGRVIAVLQNEDLAGDPNARNTIPRFPMSARNGFAPIHAAILQAFNSRGRNRRRGRRA